MGSISALQTQDLGFVHSEEHSGHARVRAPNRCRCAHCMVPSMRSQRRGHGKLQGRDGGRAAVTGQEQARNGRCRACGSGGAPHPAYGSVREWRAHPWCGGAVTLCARTGIDYISGTWVVQNMLLPGTGTVPEPVPDGSPEPVRGRAIPKPALVRVRVRVGVRVRARVTVGVWVRVRARVTVGVRVRLGLGLVTS